MRTTIPLQLSLYTPCSEPPEPAVWQTAGRLVRWSVLCDPESVAAQVRGLRGYLQRACGVRDDALFARLAEVRAVLGLTAEAGLAPEDAATALWERAGRYGGVVLDHGVLRTADGAPLARPIEPLAGPARRMHALDTPPCPSQVARRLRVLAAIGARLALEQAPNGKRRELEELRRWVQTEGLEGELDEDEQGLLFEPTLGGMGREERVAARAAVEGAAVLAWALGLLPLPVRDAPLALGPLLAVVGVGASAPEALERPTLRSPVELCALDAMLRDELAPGGFPDDAARSRATSRLRAARWLVGRMHRHALRGGDEALARDGVRGPAPARGER